MWQVFKPIRKLSITVMNMSPKYILSYEIILTLLDILIVAYAIQVPAIFINVRYGWEVMIIPQQQQ